MKITRIRHEPNKRYGKDIVINEKLKEFYEEVRKHKIEDIICIDESSINSLQKRHHCYNTMGPDSSYPRSSRRWWSYTDTYRCICG